MGLGLLAAAAVANPLDSDLGAATFGGGCYPTGVNPALFDMVTLVNPEWAPVVSGSQVASAPVLIHGTVQDMHGDLGGDFPSTHLRSDVNYFVKLDPEDAGRLATGNDDGLVAFEWEAGVYPAFAWAGAGDRVVGLGRFIFDCGHPAPTDGTCSATRSQRCVIDSDCGAPACASCAANETCSGVRFGYSSELHPPYATAVIRQGRGALIVPPYRSAIPVTRADVFVGPLAGGAGDRCVLTHRADTNSVIGQNCYPLAQPIAAVNARDFKFSIPLPPKPANGKLAMSLQRQSPPGGVQAFLDVSQHLEDAQPHVDVTVLLTGNPANPHAPPPTGFAGTIFAGWRNDPTPLVHMRVSLEDVTIRNALRPAVPLVPKRCVGTGAACGTSADCGTGGTCLGAGAVTGWHLQAAVNGEWKELDGLDHVNTGNVIPLNVSYDQYLRRDGSLRLQVNGSARDCVSTMFGKSLAQDILELGLSNGIVCLNSTEHSPGEIDVQLPGPEFGAGSSGTEYKTVSVGGAGGVCSGTTAGSCLLDTDCQGGGHCALQGGAMAMHYRIERLPR